MKLLIADDQEVNRKVLRMLMEREGHQVIDAADGQEALQVMTSPDAPRLALLDWEMPLMDGVEICRQIRARKDLPFVYIILWTVRSGQDDIVAGLHAGANDYVTKPFDRKELIARVGIGVRTIELHKALEERVAELENAMAQIKQLRGLLPICCYCKKVRDDQNYWQEVELYVAERSDAQFSHGICPECFKKMIADLPKKS